jgi:hypothetical protein
MSSSFTEELETRLAFSPPPVSSLEFSHTRVMLQDVGVKKTRDTSCVETFSCCNFFRILSFAASQLLLPKICWKRLFIKLLYNITWLVKNLL